MSAEMYASYLRRWLRAGHVVLVAQREGAVVGEAELVENREPNPYGPALHLSLLFVHAACQGQGVGRALLKAAEELARERGCMALTTQPEQPARPFYSRVGFASWLRLREWQARAREIPLAGRLAPVPAALYPEGRGLVLRSGRYQCARHAWHELLFYLPLPEHTRLPWGRWRVESPAGEVAWVGLRAQPLEPSQCDGYVWALPQADLAPLVDVLQVQAARLGFNHVDLLLEEPEGKTMAAERGLECQGELVLWRKTISEQ